MGIDFAKIWADSEDDSPLPGVTPEQIAAWETRHGVKLPEVLARALRRQNGGLIRYSSVCVFPLTSIIPVDRELLSDMVYSKKKFANPALIFQFADCSEDEPLYFLNFNTNGPEGEPTVYHWYHDPSELSPTAKTVRRFFKDLSDVNPTPGVDWSETTRLDEILFQERIDTTREYEDVEEYNGQEVFEEIILGRLNGQLIHYIHDVTLWAETFSRTVLPEPLSKSDASIDQQRPSPGKTYGLHLEPKDGDDIVSIDCEKQADGLWKNSISNGVPIYITVESRSKDALKALREKMFGKKAASKVAEQDDALEQMEAMFEGLDPTQKQAAAAAFASEMLDQMMGEVDAETQELIEDDEIPAEVRQMLANMERAMDGLQAQADQKALPGAGDPDVAAVVDLMRRSQGDLSDEDLDDDEDDEDDE